MELKPEDLTFDTYHAERVGGTGQARAIAQTQVRLYGCHDRPRPVAGSVTHFAQNGYDYTELTESGAMHRHAVVVPMRQVMSTECQYDKQQSDRSCTNCKHIRK